MKRTLAFDLDDTLYDESDYVHSGIATVAQAFAGEFGQSVAALQGLFTQLLVEGGREHLFNRALSQLGIEPSTAIIERMVGCYRAQQPSLNTYPGVPAMLEQLAQDYRLVLVTDGLPLMQRNKVAGLGIGQYFERIIYCWEHDAPKPDAAGFRLAIGEGAMHGAMVIGDHPVNDGEPARVLALPFVRIQSARFRERPGGDIVLQSVTELPGVLDRA